MLASRKAAASSAQIAELAIGERTYRAQVAELHRAVAERLEKRLQEADRVAWRVLVGGEGCVAAGKRKARRGGAGLV